MPNGVVYENFLAKPYKYPIFPEGGVAVSEYAPDPIIPGGRSLPPWIRPWGGVNFERNRICLFYNNRGRGGRCPNVINSYLALYRSALKCCQLFLFSFTCYARGTSIHKIVLNTILRQHLSSEYESLFIHRSKISQQPWTFNPIYATLPLAGNVQFAHIT